MFVQYVDDIMQIRPYQQEMRSSLDVMEWHALSIDVKEG
jgi:hypothetical protein